MADLGNSGILGIPVLGILGFFGILGISGLADLGILEIWDFRFWEISEKSEILGILGFSCRKVDFLTRFMVVFSRATRVFFPAFFSETFLISLPRAGAKLRLDPFSFPRIFLVLVFLVLGFWNFEIWDFRFGILEF